MTGSRDSERKTDHFHQYHRNNRANANNANNAAINAANAANAASSDSVSSFDSGADADAEEMPEVPRWRNWGERWEHGKIVAMSAGLGVRFYANYQLDDEGGMNCVLLAPRGVSVVHAARQLQRFFTIEQHRLMILSRLPGAKSRFPILAKLNSQYEQVANAIRRMNSAGTRREEQRYRQQQEFVERITNLEQAVEQELTRSKSEAMVVKSYEGVISSRLSEAGYTPLGGEVRFLPYFVSRRLEPAINSINGVAERAQILSDALERTTATLQAGVDVRTQRLSERLTLYGLIFASISVFITGFNSISPNGALHLPYKAFCKWLAALIRDSAWLVSDGGGWFGV